MEAFSTEFTFKNWPSEKFSKFFLVKVWKKIQKIIFSIHFRQFIAFSSKKFFVSFFHYQHLDFFLGAWGGAWGGGGEHEVEHEVEQYFHFKIWCELILMQPKIQNSNKNFPVPQLGSLHHLFIRVPGINLRLRKWLSPKKLKLFYLWINFDNW